MSNKFDNTALCSPLVRYQKFDTCAILKFYHIKTNSTRVVRTWVLEESPVTPIHILELQNQPEIKEVHNEVVPDVSTVHLIDVVPKLQGPRSHTWPEIEEHHNNIVPAFLTLQNQPDLLFHRSNHSRSHCWFSKFIAPIKSTWNWRIW